MQPIKCPHCGAPPPQPINQVGQFTYYCQYCRQQSLMGTPAQAPPQQPTGQMPQFIVIHTPGGYDDDDDDDDHDHHHYHHQAIAHATVARSASWIIWLIVVLVVSLGGAGAGFARCGRHSSIISGLVWDGKEPLQCGGNDDISVSGVEANFTGGAAIVAGGNCHFRCTDCKISSQIAIEAGGNAQVTIINGTIKGTTILADASGNARVNISGNVVSSGAVRQSANAKVTAPVQVASAAPTPEPPTATPAKAATPPVAATSKTTPKPKAAPSTKPK